jgi:hypothetical protein
MICEVGGWSSYLTLTKTNYADWALLMKVKLRARDLWTTVEKGGSNVQEDMMVLDALSSVVLPEMVSAVVSRDTTKEV